ncbi:MAG TPA: pyridoxamine 5'-phosphate oxidase family protein [Blastocatellia bacterium]|nr:pyridoxamine 5'-phosphate oxidase family protein [Blastocatellia bacterium]
MDQADQPLLAEPQTSRPHMPGYGIPEASTAQGLLPWSWAIERLTTSCNYWLSTTRKDGRPHSMPVWGVWLEGRFYFSTGRDSLKARNLAANAYCVVCPERGDEAVIMEGVAEEVTDRSRYAAIIDAYNLKYQWNMDGSEGPIYAVRPRVVFGFDIKEGQFTSSATRWTFEEE